MNLDFLVVSLYSYILGSIPFGLLITKYFLNKDVRNIGSGNIGATNVLRTGKKNLAFLTLILDVLKGYLSVFITFKFFNEFIYLASLICLLGHIFPIWLKFKGGKGVATYLGVILALSYKYFLVFGLSWLVMSFIFRFASLSSITSSLLVLIYSYFYQSNSFSIIFFIFFVIMIYTHKENIVRLKNSTEAKIKL